MDLLRSTIHLALSLPLLAAATPWRQGGPSRAAPVGGPAVAPAIAEPGSSATARARAWHPAPPVAPEPASTAPPAPLDLDPEGVRVVPYRPADGWPHGRRLHPRIYDPFRNFPRRAISLCQMMYPRDPRD